jgi:hypothetical protein
MSQMTGTAVQVATRCVMPAMRAGFDPPPLSRGEGRVEPGRTGFSRIRCFISIWKTQHLHLENPARSSGFS